jgi:hypothetical protein
MTEQQDEEDQGLDGGQIFAVVVGAALLLFFVITIWAANPNGL